MKKFLILMIVILAVGCSKNEKTDNPDIHKMAVESLLEYSGKLDDSIMVLKLQSQALLNMTHGNWDSSAVYLNRAVSLDSTNPVLLRLLAITRLRLGEYDAAASIALKMHSFAKSDPHYTFLNALVQDKAGKSETARNAYTDCIRLIENSSDGMDYTMIRLMSTMLSGDLEKGKAEVRAYIAATKDDSFSEVLDLDRDQILDLLLQ